MKNYEKEMLVKSQAFGTMEKIKADFGHIPSPERLKEPLREGAGINAFCRGCGSYFQIMEEIITDLSNLLEKDIPPQEYFVDTNFCPFCDSQNKEAELRKILDL